MNYVGFELSTLHTIVQHLHCSGMLPSTILWDRYENQGWKRCLFSRKVASFPILVLCFGGHVKPSVLCTWSSAFTAWSHFPDMTILHMGLNNTTIQIPVHKACMIIWLSHIFLPILGQFVPDQENNQVSGDNGDEEEHVNEFLANPSSDKIMEHPMQVMTQGGRSGEGAAGGCC